MRNLISLVCIVGATGCQTNMLLEWGPPCPFESRPATEAEWDGFRSQLATIDGAWSIDWAERDASVFTVSIDDDPVVYAIEGQLYDGVQCGADFKYFLVEPANLGIQADWMTTGDISALRVSFTAAEGPSFEGTIDLDDLDATFFGSGVDPASADLVRLSFGVATGFGTTASLGSRVIEGDLSINRTLARCDGSCVAKVN